MGFQYCGWESFPPPPLYLHVDFWAAPMISGFTGLSSCSLPTAKEAQMLLLHHPQRTPDILKAEWVSSSGTVILDHLIMTAPREDRRLTKLERKKGFIGRTRRAMWRGAHWLCRDVINESFLHPIPVPFLGGELHMTASSFLFLCVYSTLS